MTAVRDWLEALGLGELAPVFEAQDIDTDVLPLLTEADLRDDLGLSLGHRKKVMRAIRDQFGGEQAAEAAPDRPQPPAPPAAAQPVRDAERRQITILFCDLTGSTRIAQAVDVETYATVLGTYQRRSAEVIARYDGHVAQFLGDGVLCYFGYPLAHEDDCERALIAAADLHAEIGRLDTGLGDKMQIRIGIDTGLVVVGDLSLSPDGDIDSVAGETPNRAARLQTLAEPGEIVIGDQTRRLLGGFAEFEDMGLQSLKGFTEPARAWRASPEDIRNRSHGERRRRSATPLVGRAQESQLLLDRWQQCLRGEGEVVILSGEAGIGKSRLLAHLVDAVPEESSRGLTLHCSSYNRNTAFGPVAEQLRRQARFRPKDGPVDQIRRLEAFAASSPVPKDQALALIAPLCGVALEPGTVPAELLDMTPERRTAETIALMTSWIVMRARRGPLLVVGEDMQWADPSTLELIDRMIEETEHLPVMFVLTHRPEFRRGWHDLPNATTLRLNRFASANAVDLVRAVTNGLTLPGELEAEILDKTDGVPLFIEEVTRNLLESGALRQIGTRLERTDAGAPIDIPATLNEALLTRLDRMNAVKEIALWAAALGRRFSLELLERVGPFSREELFSALERLTASDILRRGGRPPQEFYEFRHALVREAAYNSMLSDKRRGLHQRIVSALLDHEPDLMSKDPDLLEQHYQRAGEHAKAAEAAIAAGDQIARTYTGPEARRRYLAALDLAEGLGAEEEAERLRIRAVLKLATTSLTGEEIGADLQRLEGAVARAEAIGAMPRLVQALYWIGRLHYVSGRLDKATEYAHRAQEIGAESENPRMRAGPENLLARICCLQGEAVRAEELAARNRRDLAEIGNALEEATITGVHAFALASAGRYREADEVSALAVQMADRLEHGPTIAANAMFRTVALGWSGDLAAGGEWAERALDAADACGDVFRRYVTLGWWGESLMRGAERSGDGVLLSRARERFADCFEISRRLGINFHLSAYLALDGLAALLAGAPEEAGRLVAEACDIGEAADQPWGLSIAWQVAGQIALAGGVVPAAAAVEGLERAIAIQEERGLLPELVRSRRVLAALLRAGGDERAAAEAERRAATEAAGLDPGGEGSRDTA